MWDVFASKDLSFDFKLEVTRKLILSKLSYGQDVISLNSSQIKRLESLLSKCLRAALQQPRRSKTAALQMIAGQPSIESLFQTRRLQNFIRISSLPRTRLIRSFTDERQWRKSGQTVNSFYKDKAVATRFRKFSSGKDSDWEEYVEHYSKEGTKRVLKKIFFNKSRMMAHRDIQGSHSSSFLKVFDSFTYYPLLKRKGQRYENFITWMTASTDIYEDKTDQEIITSKDRTQSEQETGSICPERCRLCKTDTESREHFLTDCSATVHLITDFIESIQEISNEKCSEFLELPNSERWLWILGCGVIPLELQGRTPRLIPFTAVFTKGKSVNTGFDRNDPIISSYAYYEFKEIEHQLSPEDIVVYTDGSFKDHMSGSAAIIYRDNRQIHEISSPTGDMPIAYAELFAILITLRWLKESSTFNRHDVHFFVDNIFARDSLCDTKLPRKHFFLIQDIKHVASSIKFTRRFFIHWIPSHVDKYTQGQFAITGNQQADKLAGNAQRITESLSHFPAGVEDIRERIMEESVKLTWRIRNMLKFGIPTPDGPSSDDFSSANADQIILSEEDL